MSVTTAEASLPITGPLATTADLLGDAALLIQVGLDQNMEVTDTKVLTNLAFKGTGIMKAQGIKTLKLGKNSIKKEKEILDKAGDVINNALEKAVNENTGG